jgi:hypothetical protein
MKISHHFIRRPGGIRSGHLLNTSLEGDGAIHMMEFMQLFNYMLTTALRHSAGNNHVLRNN